MNGKPWDSLEKQVYDDFIEYGMYDILALSELYIQVNKQINIMDSMFL